MPIKTVWPEKFPDQYCFRYVFYSSFEGVPQKASNFSIRLGVVNLPWLMATCDLILKTLNLQSR